MDILPGVSVIIPVYNMAEHLNRCVQSVLRQTYSNLEILLIDDGSTDSSARMCMRYSEQDNRVIYLRRQNKGLGEARNLGLRASSFEYITFLDSDDWLELDFVDELLRGMLVTEADIGVCDIYYVDSFTMQKEISQIRLPNIAVAAGRDRTAVNKCRTFAWGKIYKKALFTDNGIWYPAHSFEDIPCTPVLVALAQKIIRIAKPLHNYLRSRPGSLSNDAGNILDIERSLKLLYFNFKKADLFSAFSLEFKKILIGQLRFAYRKWGEIKNSETQRRIECLTNLTDDYFPGLRKKLFDKYYAYGGDMLLQNALDCVIPLREQIVAFPEDADTIVSFESVIIEGKRIINIQKPGEDEDESSIAWEIAEKIMETI